MTEFRAFGVSEYSELPADGSSPCIDSPVASPPRAAPTTGRCIVYTEASPSPAAPSCQLGGLSAESESSARPVELQPPTCFDSRLHDIAISKLRLSASKDASLVRLLQPAHLQSLHVPKGTRAWPKLGVSNINFRHHFYRQAAKILGWQHRHEFPDELKVLVHKVWPDQSLDLQVKKRHVEEAGETHRKQGMSSL